MIKIGLLIRILFAVFSAAAAGTISIVSAAVAMSVKTATIQNVDCIKCHEKECITLRIHGGRHRAVGCLGCHKEHPPSGVNVIPKCSECHRGKSHYRLEGCLTCHIDPHKPLALEFRGNTTKPCLTCHPKEGKEFQEYPSTHARLACTLCHTRHGEKPSCLRCHKPHTKGQTLRDCLECHPAHTPLLIQYPNEIPRSYCTPCHRDIGKLMAKTTTKHKTFTCAFCHRGVHRIIPQCETCHGLPHPPAMHKAHPNCLDCHMDAHNLVT